ncbi:MAG: HD domain-containing protein [bacterium]|nr:HD domain-containing protein [bacterium]
MYNQIYQNKEYYQYAKDILRNSEFQRRKTFLHHQDSVYEHSIRVSLVAYKMAKFLAKYIPISIEDVVIGALLHDFYLTPWRDSKGSLHGFRHGKIASINANHFFPSKVNDTVLDSIHRHMFPLTIIPPKYYEGWIVTLADKYVSLEVFTKPSELPKYIGIDRLAKYPKLFYLKTKKLFSMV